MEYKQHNIYLLGAPGVGKGTQAQKLAVLLKVPQLSTGDMLREARKEKGKLADRLASYMDVGTLVPDDLVITLVQLRLQKPDCAQGVILDGFPRTKPQAEALDKLFTEDKRTALQVISIEVPETEIRRRLEGRLVCPLCNRSYHVAEFPPKASGVCDVCGGTLTRREDDEPAVVSQRLRAYAEKTAPLVAYYQSRHLFSEINGVGNTEEVFQRILDRLHIGNA